MGISEKVEAAIKEAFPDSSLNLEESSGGKLFGMIVSPQFAKMPDRSRQQMLWGVLQKRLTIDDQTQITAILTVTPEEDNLLSEE
jgi:stress-induced morphogen